MVRQTATGSTLLRRLEMSSLPLFGEDFVRIVRRVAAGSKTSIAANFRPKLLGRGQRQTYYFCSARSML